MPPKKSYQAYRRRRLYKSQLYRSFERSRKRKGRFKNSQCLLGAKKRITFKYTDIDNLTPVAGAADVMIFSCNGLFDPNISGIGHQPRGWDQMMALYDHYCVLKANISIICAVVPATEPQFVSIALRDKASPAYAGYADILEDRFVKHGVVAEGSPLTLSYTIDVGKFLGIKNPVNEKDLWGDIGNNPTEQCYFHVSAFNMNGGSPSTGVQITYVVKYDTMLLEPKNPTAS